MAITPLLLVVEDEVLLHLALEDDLIGAGYKVLLVANGQAAIAELDKGADRFKALVTDIRLGKGPNGWEIAHRARELVPSLPVVYMSGDSASEWSVNGVPKSIMLSKPFAMAQLVIAVSQLINETDATI
ncbi:Response regulator receiver protein [Devosia equisanguinis]|uniref:Response regulator receiver protein n=2 Tax=Devosia equisanguinis TaxID=2490941 RepID=A0A447I8C1_9HYPH|nr:Response regulator receiver protein [Devosia equisanguinis]